MSLVCALSNEVPEHPVLSPASGCIFEKRLIEKYLSEKEVDPITGDVLTPDMLIEVKTTTTTSQNHPLVIKPRPPSATSIPALLKCLQDEWDAVMLNSFTLRQQLQTTRQELSHALYQHDAACRVIARLNKEVTAAREALATLKPQTQAQLSNALTGASNGEIMDAEKSQEESGLSEKVIQKLQDKASQLTSERKKRVKTMPEDLTKPDAMKLFKQASSHLGLHSVSSPGILSLDIFTVDSSKILTGGNDKNAVVFDKETNQVIATLKGHTKKVSSVVYHNQNNVALTASPDQTIRVWDVPKQSCSQIIKAHDGAVTGISLHPTGDYVLSSSLDEHWAFADLASGKVLCKVADANNSSPLTCIQFHPDGLIFGTGTQDAMIKIWDLKEKSNVANFPGHSGAITALAFSENGYYLATSADDSIVKLWDLRKLKNFKTIPMDEENNKYEIRSLTFDYSGNYLAVAGTDVRVYLSKQWQELCCLKDHTALATGVKFGPNASFLASTSMDRSLKFYSE